MSRHSCKWAHTSYLITDSWDPSRNNISLPYCFACQAHPIFVFCIYILPVFCDRGWPSGCPCAQKEGSTGDHGSLAYDNMGIWSWNSMFFTRSVLYFLSHPVVPYMPYSIGAETSRSSHDCTTSSPQYYFIPDRVPPGHTLPKDWPNENRIFILTFSLLGFSAPTVPEICEKMNFWTQIYWHG